MRYVVRRVAIPPTPDEQARNFWDAIQKLSLFFGLVLTIRSLLK
jgi:hypothetical protein